MWESLTFTHFLRGPVNGSPTTQPVSARRDGRTMGHIGPADATGEAWWAPTSRRQARRHAHALVSQSNGLPRGHAAARSPAQPPGVCILFPVAPRRHVAAHAGRAACSRPPTPGPLATTPPRVRPAATVKRCRRLHGVANVAMTAATRSTGAHATGALPGWGCCWQWWSAGRPSMTRPPLPRCCRHWGLSPIPAGR
jgi:hypothetical protein